MALWYCLALLLAVVLICELYTLKTGVPTLSSFPSARRKMIDILQHDQTWLDRLEGRKPPLILDLGSGGGQLTWHIAKAFPESSVVGIEISYFPWLLSVIRKTCLGPSNLQYKRLDFWTYDCSQVDVAITYLTENIIERVSSKLRSELKPGALVLANDTALRAGWQPVEIADTGLLHMKIFVYRA